MSSTFWVWLAIGILTCLGWLAALGITIWTNRPKPLKAEHATDHLGSESPAIVALIAHQWRITEHAIAGTILHLAARGVLHLQRTGPDPAQATIAVSDGSGNGLAPYEQRVLAHVIRMTGGGQAPVSALAMESESEAEQWFHEFGREVISSAREQNLSQPLISRPLWTAFVIATLVPATCVAIATMTVNTLAAAFTGVLTFALLLLLLANFEAERDTPKGRRVATRWLGVAEFLAGRPDFARQAPSSIRDWGAPLAYGAALGLNPVISDVLTISTRAHERAWSGHGRTWRRVAIRYPWYPFWGWRVTTAVSVSMTALGWSGVAWWVLTVKLDGLETLGWAIAIASGIVAFVLLGGALVDAAAPKRIDGQVLQVVERSRRKWGGPRWLAPPRRWIAVDDGRDNTETKAFVLPPSMAYAAQAGEQVTVVVGRTFGLVRSIIRH
ncbi:MAG: DUF2207 domain-containing protein [Corynebacteriales bacterium]|nr:DUF2207 domain-containing protein [Mycobacteriales bacterium]